jgi:hypothetical protein
MAQTIRIKRSTGTSAPSTLAQGELAYSHGSMTFYVGDPSTADTPVPIGGAIINNAGTPILATGVTGAEVRSLIGAGTGSGTVTDQPAVINSAGTPTLDTGITAGEMRTLLDVDVAGTDNSTDVTLNTASYDYLSLSGQQITLNQIDATTDISGLATIATTGTLGDITGGNSDDIPEGSTNEYFTNTKARNALSGGTGVTYTAGTGVIAIGQAVGTGNSPTFVNLTLTGDLDVQGSINSTSTTELLVEDTTISLNSTYTGSSPTLDASIEVERGTVNNARIIWNETSNQWEIDNGTGTGSAIVTSATAGGVGTVTAGALLDNSGTAADPILDVDLSELVDMTAAAVGTDEVVLLDAGVQRRKAFNEIPLSIFDDDLVYNNYVHPTHPGDDASVDTGPLTGAFVISDLDFNITTDSLGHVTDANATVATRQLTPANIGAATAAQGSTADSAIQTLTLSSTDGSITGVGTSSGTTPSFDLEVALVDGGTY